MKSNPSLLGLVLIGIICIGCAEESAYASDGTSVTDYQAWPRVVEDVPHVDWVHTSPKGVRDGAFRIVVMLASGGGSGGPMNRVTVTDTHSGKTLETTFQSLGVRVLEDYQGWPQFEAWSRLGAGDYERTLVRLERGKYCEVRSDNFYIKAKEATRRDVTAQVPESNDLLYYMRTTDPRK